MSDPYKIVRDFEAALCKYTGAPYCVTTTSCTMALLLAVAWHLRKEDWRDPGMDELPKINIPKRTYIGVPYAIIEAGGRPVFRDEEWSGAYQLAPLPVWDSARYLTSGIYSSVKGVAATEWCRMTGQMVCLSFHHTKHLGLAGHGGAILHDDPEADAWFRRARFDGRSEGVAPAQDNFTLPRAWHCYLTPAVAAEGLMRLAILPWHNDPLPWGPETTSDYPDLSALKIFKGGTP